MTWNVCQDPSLALIMSACNFTDEHQPSNVVSSSPGPDINLTCTTAELATAEHWICSSKWRIDKSKKGS